ncbi:Brix-domain-containing protein [Tilletiaria anomala UBC 951]|uniref:Brix-domain-containing protein n=1 Tax=Tilletiaria anomala (strain ATCC 24038 / CBS 436.72 / UBC 951) TaxID=1037660 RepID=A0A066WMV0_TILAU|nr:Brix-domain-containing protein [Tilletiaria anomala UBC 951]KDN51955.1 Brix-domain-containing protein [Tilletiaria anomala UBC 951]
MVKRQRRSTGGGHGKHRAKKRKAATNPGPLGSSSGSGDGGAKVPRSFILHSGAVSSSVSTLLHDLRSTFEPYTAANLRQTRSNRMKDFVNISGILGVSHMMVLHQPGMQRKNKAKIAAGDTLGSNGQSSVSAASDTGRVNLRIATLPHGPTLTFRVNKYSLRKDILHSQKRPPTRGNEYLTPPLLVLNNFTSQAQTGSDGKPLGTKGKEVQLMISLFQNLFPPIHVQTMHLSSARRIVLLHYNPATKTIDWRHYIIQVRPVGVSKRLRRVVEVNSATPASAVAAAAAAAGISLAGTSNKRKGLPDLGNVNDISDYVLGRRSRIGGGDESRDEDNGDDAHSGFETDASTDADDSDVEDGEGGSARRNTVDLFQDYMGRGNAGKASQRAREAGSNQRAVKLRELGPRMELRLIKIEEGFGGGEVLYHDYGAFFGSCFFLLPFSAVLIQ